MMLCQLIFKASPRTIADRKELTTYLSKHISGLRYISTEMQDGFSTITFATRTRNEDVIINLLNIKGHKVSFVKAVEIEDSADRFM